MLRSLPIALFAVTAAFSPFLQTPAEKGTPPAAAQGARGTNPDAKQTDELLGTWLRVGGENQVALCELALQRASSPEVKAFAQQMLDEHRGMLAKLQPFASSSGAIDAGAPARPTDPKGSRPGAGGAPSSGFDHAGLLTELGAQCLESSRKELMQKQGAEFDRCFVGMAIGSHMGANDMLTVFQRHASPSLAPVLADSQRVVATHLQHAKELAKKLEGKPAETREPAGKQ